MAKYSAFGTVFTLGGSAVVQVTNIDGPELSLDTVDVTTHDSASGWEEVVGTILRSGEVSLDIVYDPAAATHVALWTDLVAKAPVACTLVYPDHPTHTTWSFNALVTKFKPGMPVDGALTGTVTLKITGAPTLA